MRANSRVPKMLLHCAIRFVAKITLIHPFRLWATFTAFATGDNRNLIGIQDYYSRCLKSGWAMCRPGNPLVRTKLRSFLGTTEKVVLNHETAFACKASICSNPSDAAVSRMLRKGAARADPQRHGLGPRTDPIAWVSPVHPLRSTLSEEAFCVYLLGIAPLEILRDQLGSYLENGYPMSKSADLGGPGLLEGEWHFRDLRLPTSMAIGNTWFEEFSKWLHVHPRDQISANYATWKGGMMGALSRENKALEGAGSGVFRYAIYGQYYAYYPLQPLESVVLPGSRRDWWREHPHRLQLSSMSTARPRPSRQWIKKSAECIRVQGALSQNSRLSRSVRRYQRRIDQNTTLDKTYMVDAMTVETAKYLEDNRELLDELHNTLTATRSGSEVLRVLENATESEMLKRKRRKGLRQKWTPRLRSNGANISHVPPLRMILPTGERMLNPNLNSSFVRRVRWDSYDCFDPQDRLAGVSHVKEWMGSNLSEAMERCERIPKCNVIVDWRCDGINYRVCQRLYLQKQLYQDCGASMGKWATPGSEKNVAVEADPGSV
eukprot:CAMPEP_0115836500 /NCGR_PEP_ID=MMETSP0287-20121206/4738_1 /TAXON_ID=412157 /ORGANISM="Chrysochromulina rotalis, Strain UIO044" /LENGTH=546 /DNA_ID=CAMNT_0003289983 /DNA_START=59 /DNA_END=1699 /DNA_ORIENTATION=-